MSRRVRSVTACSVAARRCCCSRALFRGVCGDQLLLRPCCPCSVCPVHHRDSEPRRPDADAAAATALRRDVAVCRAPLLIDTTAAPRRRRRLPPLRAPAGRRRRSWGRRPAAAAARPTSLSRCAVGRRRVVGRFGRGDGVTDGNRVTLAAADSRRGTTRSNTESTPAPAPRRHHRHRTPARPARLAATPEARASATAAARATVVARRP